MNLIFKPSLFGIAVFAPICFASALVADDLLLTDLIKQVEPSVVRIDVDGKHGESIGSGFVVDSTGIVVTNHHVIAGASSAEVSFQNKKTAKVLGTLYLDKSRDIAVLKIDGNAYSALRLAGELPLKGASVTAFGAPVGLSFSATEGIVSAVREIEELKEYTSKMAGTWIQTSTPISPGNSGGPLVNNKGEVVGANTMGMVIGQNLNFAISSIDIAEAVKASQQLSLVKLDAGAAMEVAEYSLDRLGGTKLVKAIDEISSLLLVADLDSREAQVLAAQLVLVDPDKVSDAKVKQRVVKVFKRIAYESKSNGELGVRGMARWGGDAAIPYFVELLDMNVFHGEEAIYAALSESKDPRASEAIALRLGSFFDGQRAWAALRRMGPAAEPGLILAVSSSDLDVCLGSISLLAKHGTEASLSILSEAQRKGTPAVRKEAKRAATKIRTRARRAAREAEEKE
ncbi:MAG: trypsin-like serine protease [Planctomycetes bacterium]|nr:trypsin-like serine protease [Planctomycetota bacterium]